jgi:hypothetical protein
MILQMASHLDLDYARKVECNTGICNVIDIGGNVS